MVSVTTNGAMAAEPAPAADDEKEPSWFIYEGPKISLAFTAGASKNMTLLGFQATTNINHKQSISWGTVAVESSGPLFTEIEIKGPRKTIKMELGASLEIAPLGAIRRFKTWLAARGVQAQTVGAGQDDDGSDLSAKPVEVESDGAKSETGPKANANVGHVQS